MHSGGRQQRQQRREQLRGVHTLNPTHEGSGEESAALVIRRGKHVGPTGTADLAGPVQEAAGVPDDSQVCTSVFTVTPSTERMCKLFPFPSAAVARGCREEGCSQHCCLQDSAHASVSVRVAGEEGLAAVPQEHRSASAAALKAAQQSSITLITTRLRGAF